MRAWFFSQIQIRFFAGIYCVIFFCNKQLYQYSSVDGSAMILEIFSKAAIKDLIGFVLIRGTSA